MVNGMRITAAVLVALALAGCGGGQPDPAETLTAEQLETFNEHALSCLDGDPFACNRLRDMAAPYSPEYEKIGATCGRTLDDPLPRGEYCD